MKTIDTTNRSKSMSNIEVDRLEKFNKVKSSNSEKNDYDDSELSSTLERAFMKQLHDTICRLDYRKLNSSRDYPYGECIGLTVKSTEEDLQNWLISKGFSKKIIKMFEKCNGRNAFLLEKDVLKKYCGREADRLYSLLLIEKNRSGYKTYTSRELELLLQHRKTKTEKDNDGDNSEPLQRPPSVLQTLDFSEEEETIYDDVENFIVNDSNTKDKCFHVRQISLDSISNNSYEYQRVEEIKHKNNDIAFKEVYEKYKVANDVSQNDNHKSHLVAAYY